MARLVLMQRFTDAGGPYTVRPGMVADPRRRIVKSFARAVRIARQWAAQGGPNGVAKIDSDEDGKTTASVFVAEDGPWARREIDKGWAVEVPAARGRRR